MALKAVTIGSCATASRWHCLQATDYGTEGWHYRELCHCELLALPPGYRLWH